MGVFRYRLIIGEPRNSIKEMDDAKHLDRVATGTFKYIRDLITESPYNLLDPDLQRFLLHDMMMLSFRAPYDPDARGELDKINDALKGGGTQGKDSPAKLKEIIERDIAYYRRVLKSGGAKVRNLPDSITIDRAEQICRAYKGIMEKLAPVIP